MPERERNPPLSETLDRYEAAKSIIPGGTQLLSKRPEMHAPDQWPAYYSDAEGVRVVDLDGNEFTDMSLMGVGACVLGYGDEDVDAAARQAIDAGVMTSLNAPEEVDLAEKLLEMHGWADMVRFGRPGGEAMAMAVRLARAHTGSETVAFCGYHGWHDWYLAANLASDDNLEEHLLPGLDPSGVPRSLEGTSKPFEYNDVDELEAIARNDDLAAIVMEPIRYKSPEAGFVERVREIADREGAPLIFDEITSGFRVRPGGYHGKFDIEPDVAVYGKAMGNGYPIAAVVGKRAVMAEAQQSFISSTFWTERIGPAAALATIEKFRRQDVGDHLVAIGEQITSGWLDLAEDNGVPIETMGMKPLTTFSIDHDDGQAATTLFTQEMLERGYLAGNSVYVSLAHTPETVATYLEAVDDLFGIVADALAADEVHDRLDGPVAHTKFERLN